MTLDEPKIDALTGGIYFGIVEGLRCADGDDAMRGIIIEQRREGTSC